MSCLLAPQDRSFLVSADTGPDSLLVGWDPESEQAVWTVRGPHPHGVAAAALTPDGRMLATLSTLPPPDAGGGTQQQEVRVLARLQCDSGNASLRGASRLAAGPWRVMLLVKKQVRAVP